MFVLPNRIAPAALQLGDHGGVVRRPKAAQHPAAAGRRLALDAEHVLDRDRHARQRPKHLARSSATVERAGLSQDSVGIEMHEHVESFQTI